MTVQKLCAYDVRKAPIHDLPLSVHKTRGFEWQTAYMKGCRENSCAPKKKKAELTLFCASSTIENNKAGARQFGNFALLNSDWLSTSPIFDIMQRPKFPTSVTRTQRSKIFFAEIRIDQSG